MSQASFSLVRQLGSTEPSEGTDHRSTSVDQAASAPTDLAANTTSAPSGEMASSSAPPKGLVGVSTSSAFIRSIASPLARSWTKAWLRLPSS